MQVPCNNPLHKTPRARSETRHGGYGRSRPPAAAASYMDPNRSGQEQEAPASVLFSTSYMAPRRPEPGPASRAAPWAASTSEDGASPSRRGGIAAQPPPGPGPLPSRQVPGAKKQSQPRASSTAVCAPLPSHRCGPRDPGGGWSAAGGPGRLDDLPSSARRGSTLPEFLKGGGAFWCSCG